MSLDPLASSIRANFASRALAPYLAVALTLLLAPLGCQSNAPLSKTQCEIGDWQTLGHRDGAQGLPSTQLLALQEACIEHGIRAERDDYMLGWSEGVRTYCRPNHGLTLGESGEAHNNICPDDLRPDFIAAYQEGRSYYLAQVRVVQLDEEIEEKTERLEEVRSDIVSTAAAQLNPLLTPTRRAELVAELQSLNDERKRLQESLPELRADLVEQREALAERERLRGQSF